MLRNYLTIAIRNLLNSKMYSLINVLGLSVGMACCILIASFLEYELAWDSFWPNADRIYRITHTEWQKGKLITPAGELTQTILDAFPEIEDAVRLHWWHVWSQRGKTGQDKLICLVDQRVFDFFDFQLLQGDAETAFQSPFSAVITDRMAQQYFGDEDPIGKTFEVIKTDAAGIYTVTGVMRRLAHTTLPRFDFMTTQLNHMTQPLWERKVPTYIRLRPGASFRDIEPRLSALITNHLHIKATFRLQPLTRVYLYGDSDFYPGRLSRRLVYFSQLTTISVIILLLACINYVNLSTARSAQRAREVGIRKVAGAHRQQLIHQFLSESVLLSLIAVLLAFGIAQIAQPTFSSLLGRKVSLGQPWIWSGAFGTAFVIGILAGCYPSFFLARFEPVLALKGFTKSGRKSGFRQGLVVFQFATAILLIICTAIVYQQLHFFRNRPLGFDKDHLIIVPVFREGWETNERHPERRLSERYQTVRDDFLQHPNLLKGTAGFLPPHDPRASIVYASDNPEEKVRVRFTDADENFLETYNVPLVSGRNFTGAVPEWHGDRQLIVNESAVKQFGWTKPIGKRIGSEATKQLNGTIVGVMKDFHHQSLRLHIEPLIVSNNRSGFWHLVFKVRSNNMPETMAFLKEKWNQFCAIREFEYFFMDEVLDRQYRNEERQANVLTASALLAIFVACLGLLGLATHTAERRTKEIGVRKVLGASTRDIVMLLSQTFAKSVLLANVIAWPVAYMLMQGWLENYAYRITLGLDMFLLGTALAMLIALVTVGYQAVRAATANPADALRYE